MFIMTSNAEIEAAAKALFEIQGSHFVGKWTDAYEKLREIWRERARAALTAAERARWQPIETAPKDGTPVLLWLKNKFDRNYTVMGLCDLIRIGFWQHRRWVTIEVEDCWMPDWCPLDVNPSHWRELPSPPDGAEAGTKHAISSE
jgi:hypothetical protein